MNRVRLIKPGTRAQNLLRDLVCVAAVVTAVGTTLANDYYVDVEWQGTEAGSPTQPYNTIGEAVAAANAVAAIHNIYIAEGIYADSAIGGAEDYSAGGGTGGGYNLARNISIFGGYAGWDGDGAAAEDFDWTAASRVPRSTRVDLQSADSRAFYRDKSAVARGGVFDGLTFCNASHGTEGGTIWDYGNGTQLYVRNCLFTNNVTTGTAEGGAVRLYGNYAHVTIEDCDFVDNSAYRGGAARLSTDPSNYYDSRASMTVQRSTFVGNIAVDYSGAMEVSGGGPFMLEDCTFTGNTAGSYAGALRFNSPGHIFTARRNRFSDNTSTSGAAAVRFSNTSTFTLENCLFDANTGPYTIETIGGSLTLRHCTLASNNATTAALYTMRPLTVRNSIVASNGSLGIQRSGTQTVDVDYTDVWGHTIANYDDVSAGAHDLSADPQFVDAANGDFRLTKNSPVIDLGTNLDITHDFDNNPRPARDGYDMGCYEEWQMPVIANRAEIAGADSVTLRAEFTYESLAIDTDAWFVLDTSDKGTTSIGSWGRSANSGEQIQGVSFDQAFAGLAPDTTYFWRCVGSNAYDMTWGPLGTFTTLSVGGVTRLWTGGGGNALASTPGNWDGGIIPTSADNIVLDSSSSNMTWDAGTGGLPDTVARWTQTENYSATVTFNTYYPEQGPFTHVTIAGDCRVMGGAWTHVANTQASETQARWLGVIVGGDFTLGALAMVNADGLGFSGFYGPGHPTPNGVQSGAGHGGFGSDKAYGRSGNIYGSVHNPTTLGSGGGRSDSPNSRGGGAIIIAVTGEAVVDGTLTANGVYSGDTNGSGGSVNLVARTLSGAGTLEAHGGSGTYIHTGSGGGRVAIRLTQTGAGFGAFTGSMTAYGGSRSVVSGAAGTVYRQTGDQADGQGTLVVDNGDLMPYLTGISTDMPAGVNLNDFAAIIITNKGVLGVSATDTMDFGLGRIVGAGAADAYISISSMAGVTFPATYTLADYTLVGNTPIAAVGNWTIASSGCLTHGENGSSNTETYWLDLTLTGNLTVDGTINVNRKGFRGGYGPGKPTHAYGGSSYGGIGGYRSTESLAVCGVPYGSILDPVNVGSGGGRKDGSTRAGGGAVILKISGNLAINGAILAESEQMQDTVGSGGAVNISAGTISGAGPISANASYLYQGGGGGRVVVKLTQPGASFGTHAGLISAYGGNAGAVLCDGAPGTVCRSAPGMVPVVTITNFAGASCATGVLTPLRNADELKGVVVIVANGSRLGVATNAYCGELMVSSGGLLDLSGKTLTVPSATLAGVRIGGGMHSAAALNSSVVTDSAMPATGLLVVQRGGTLILLR